jgi:hypothetical protein
VAGSCEHSNKTLGSIKCGEFLDKLGVLLAYLEGLCSMVLVRVYLWAYYVCQYKERLFP